MTTTLNPKAFVRPAIGLFVALLVAAIFIKASGGDILPAFQALFRGAFIEPNSLLRTLGKSTPIFLTGLSVALALRVGLFNIGAEGQFLVGALAAATAGRFLHGPAFFHMPLTIGCGIIAGGLWGLVPGLLKAIRGTHEVIVTIMMNYLAIEITNLLVHGLLKDPTGADRTPEIASSATIWSGALGTGFHAGFFVAMVCLAGYWFMMNRTAIGYEIRAVGLNVDAARTNGISVVRSMVTAMFISGALAGLAGALEVVGNQHRFTVGFSSGYGFDGIAVALLGGANALGIGGAALLFGALNSGTRNMELMTETPRQIAGIIQAIVIVAAAIRFTNSRRKS